jgi:uncharacterized protein DUF397
VEVTDIESTWGKSSYSGRANGSCVEVGSTNGTGTVRVRDTTDRNGGTLTLTFTAHAWQVLLGAIR